MDRMIYILVIVGVFAGSTLRATPVISEFMAVNDTGLKDEDGDSSDWIEIKNAGTVTIDLDGWHLTDNSDFLTKWTFPSVLLDPGDYLVVFASGKDRRLPSSELHTNFKLSGGGESLALVMPDGTTKTSSFDPVYPPQFVDVSYGESTASSDFRILVDEGSPAKAIVPDALYDATVGSSWRDNTPGFDASAWTSGLLGVGYDRGSTYDSDIGLDVEPGMDGVNGSVYIRIPFESIPNPSNVVELTLRMKYDDGFAAFINGTRVASANAPATPLWNSLATAAHEDDDAQIFVDYDITDSSDSLSTSTNILAIHGLNVSTTSSDLLVLPQLTVRTTTNSAVTLGFLEIPTPGTPNASTSFVGVVEDTNFGIGRGFFTNAFVETLTCTEPGATLIHTLDGSEPSLSNGVLTPPADPSTAPTATLSIATTTTLRVRAVKPGFMPTNVDTQSYIFPNDVIHQTGDGFPLPTNKSLSDWDYIMDPEIINDPRFPDVAGDLLTLPTMSVVMDREKLWGPDGVYAKPLSYGMDYEGACSVEYICPDGSPGFQQDGGMRIQGSGSRKRPWSKKSLRIAFRTMYGVSKLDFPLFGKAGAERLDNIVLRGDFFDSWTVHTETSGEGIGRKNAMVLRDEYGRQTHRDMGAKTVISGGWVHLYLNGMYWGVYNTHERPDAHFAEDRFGGNDDEYDVIKTNVEVVSGDQTAWDQLMTTIQEDITDPAVYASVREQMDVDEFADYLLMNFYGGNNDWPHNNWYVMRHRPSNAPFTFVAWDVEHYIYLKNDFGPIDHFSADSPGVIWERLRQNPEFILYFADRVHKHMFNGGALTPEKCSARFMGVVNTVLAGMNGEAARWGDAYNDYYGNTNIPPYNTADHYDVVVADKVNNYFPIRTSVVFNNLRANGYYPQIDAPEFSQHGGQVPVNYPLVITTGSPAQTNAPTRSPFAQGWTESGIGEGAVGEEVLDNGTHAWRISDDSSSLIPAYHNSLSSVDLAQMYQDGWEFETVVRAVRGDIFCGWGVSTGNDPGWGLTSDERVGFSIGRDAGTDAFWVSPTHGGTINLGSGSAADFHTIRCVGVPLSSQYEFFLDGISQGMFDIKDGTTSSNFDNRVRFTSGSTGGVGREGYWNLMRLKAGESVLSQYDADIETGGGGDGEGTIYYTTNGVDPRLVGGSVHPNAISGSTVTITSPVHVKARIISSGDGEWSALTEATFVTAGDPQPGELVVSELHYHPAPPTPDEQQAGHLDGDDFEFLELLNVSAEPVDISGTRLDGAVTLDLGTLTDPDDRVLLPGERLLLAGDADAFSERYGTNIHVAAIYDGKLNNGGENFNLLLDESPLISFTYNDKSPWPESPDGDGPSLVLRMPFGDPDHNNPFAWRPSAFFGGSPGSDGPEEPAFPASPGRDDNGNGVPDVVDYAIAHPLYWSVPPTSGPGNSARISFSQNLLADQARTSVSSSTNLFDWVDLPVSNGITELHHNDGTCTYTINVEDISDTNDTLFLRLRVHHF